MKPFRFGLQLRSAPSGAEWLQLARDAEALGYDVITLPDHFTEQFAPLPALAAAAAVTSRLRLGTCVLCNDFRHPALLAKELATLDLLSDGRLEIGLGAGWLKRDYDPPGLRYDRPAVRLDRLVEALAILKALFADGEVTFEGEHYTVRGLEGQPKTVQRPHPPLYMGGGGRRMLAIAAREANTVGIHFDLREGDFSEQTMRATATVEQKLQWVEEAAGSRFDELELAIIIFALEVTDYPRAAAEPWAKQFGLSVDDVLQSPNFLFGNENEIVYTLEERRRRYGLTYLTLRVEAMRAFGPIMQRLRTLV